MFGSFVAWRIPQKPESNPLWFARGLLFEKEDQFFLSLDEVVNHQPEQGTVPEVVRIIDIPWKGKTEEEFSELNDYFIKGKFFKGRNFMRDFESWIKRALGAKGTVKNG